MNLQVTPSGDVKIVRIDGRVDTINAGELEKPVLEMIDGGTTKIVLDCSGLNYISSSGLRVFLVIQKRLMGTTGYFRLSNLQPSIREIFDISGFSTIFSVYADNDSALKG